MASTFQVCAPGKVILFGEHSVVYGKTAIAVSLNLRTTLKVSTSESSVVELHIANYPSKRWSLTDITNVEGLPHADALQPTVATEIQTAIRKLVAPDGNFSPIDLTSVATVYLINLILPRSEIKGIKLEIESQLPLSAGLGSSASISVCLSAAFLFIAGALSTKSKLTTGEEIRWSKPDLDLINKWAFVVEKLFHGSPSGLDNHTSSYGGAVVYKNGNFNHLENISPIKILLVNSMVERSTKVIVEDVRKRKSKYPAIIEPIFEAMDELASFCVDTLSGKHFSDIELYDILQDLIDMNQGLLNSLDVSHSSLQEIISVAAKNNFHAKLTGAGRGGFAFLLVRPETPTSDVDNLKCELQLKGFRCFDVVVGGKGVQLRFM